MTKDSIYAKPQQMLVDFEFDENVANVFSDMIRRSVPGYNTLVTSIGLLAAQYAQGNSHCYDLGCSLGATTLSILRQIDQRHCHLVAVDNSAAMIERCKQNLNDVIAGNNVEFICDDILNVPIQRASVVIMNLTLQFIPPVHRQQLLNKIYHGLLPGGCLILAEKIVSNEKGDQQFLENMHIAFKKANAYSDLEISQKRSALENVLIPESLDTHVNRLNQSGFSQVYSWFKCFNFSALIAVK